MYTGTQLQTNLNQSNQKNNYTCGVQNEALHPQIFIGKSKE